MSIDTVYQENRALEAEIKRLEGILHRVANHERRLYEAAGEAHDATREVHDGFICGPFVELSDWYTFGENDEIDSE